MKEHLAKLSAQFSRLSSVERWFIILVVIVVFAVINFIFIIPHFGDWGRLSRRIADARDRQQRYEDAIAQTITISNQVAKLEGAGAAVPQEDQVNNFLIAIQNQAVQSGVTIVANTPQPQRTNQFFLERIQSLRTTSNEDQLVDFLYQLGAGNSMIRVRALSVQPDPPHYALNASATLIASFQKKPPVRPAPAPTKKPETAQPAAATKSNAPAIKPVTTSAKTNAPVVRPVSGPAANPPKFGVPAPVSGVKTSTPSKK